MAISAEPILLSLLTVAGSLLPLLLGRVRGLPGSTIILSIFAAIFLGVAAFTIIHYWDDLIKQTDNILFAVWLAIAMIAGMFVQVLTENYRRGKPLFAVTA